MRKQPTPTSLRKKPQLGQAVAGRLRSFRLHQTGPDAPRPAIAATTKTKI